MSPIRAPRASRRRVFCCLIRTADVHPLSLAAATGLIGLVLGLVIASLATSEIANRVGSAVIGAAVLLLAAVALGTLDF
jgi:hypothetical protein